MKIVPFALLALLPLPAAHAYVEPPPLEAPDWQAYLQQVVQAVKERYPGIPPVGGLSAQVVDAIFGPEGLVDSLPVEQFVALLPGGDCIKAPDRVTCVRDYVFAIIDIHFAVNGLSPPLGITDFDPQYRTFGFMIAGFGVNPPFGPSGQQQIAFGAGHWYVSFNG